MVTVGWAWQQQGGYDPIGHIPRYRIVGFGRDLTQCEGEGVGTVESQSLCQFVSLYRKKGLNSVKLYSARWGPFCGFPIWCCK